MDKQDIIIYNTPDGQIAVGLYTHDGTIWLNQSQLAELFATSKANISIHISNILKERELDKNSVVKDFLITASDGKEYRIHHYALPMILAVGFRVRSVRGVNVTLGLPIIRTSVEHGTGYPIAGRGIADPSSMVDALILAARMVVNGGSRGGEFRS